MIRYYWKGVYSLAAFKHEVTTLLWAAWICAQYSRSNWNRKMVFPILNMAKCWSDLSTDLIAVCIRWGGLDLAIQPDHLNSLKWPPARQKIGLSLTSMCFVTTHYSLLYFFVHQDMDLTFQEQFLAPKMFCNIMILKKIVILICSLIFITFILSWQPLDWSVLKLWGIDRVN